MNLIEALKTGRKIKRQKDDHWFLYSLDSGYDNIYEFSVNDILADDWEVEPPPPIVVTIDREQFDKAWEKAEYLVFNNSIPKLKAIMLKELGFI